MDQRFDPVLVGAGHPQLLNEGCDLGVARVKDVSAVRLVDDAVQRLDTRMASDGRRRLEDLDRSARPGQRPRAGGSGPAGADDPYTHRTPSGDVECGGLPRALLSGARAAYG